MLQDREVQSGLYFLFERAVLSVVDRARLEGEGPTVVGNPTGSMYIKAAFLAQGEEFSEEPMRQAIICSQAAENVLKSKGVLDISVEVVMRAKVNSRGIEHAVWALSLKRIDENGGK